jgi:hypothetical protein
MKKGVYIKFNDMLNDGKHTWEECYAWLMEQKNIEDMEFYQKHGFHLCNDFSYLYPEAIFWNDKELREKFIKKLNEVPDDLPKDVENQISEILIKHQIELVGTDKENLYVKSDTLDEDKIRKIVKEYTDKFK